MSNVIKIGLTVATLLFVGLIGTASVFGWGLARPAQEVDQKDEEHPRAYHPEHGYMIYYGGGRRGGIGGGGSFRGGK